MAKNLNYTNNKLGVENALCNSNSTSCSISLLCKFWFSTNMGDPMLHGLFMVYFTGSSIYLPDKLHIPIGGNAEERESVSNQTYRNQGINNH